MEGYDYELVEKLFSLADFPMTVLGGAGSLQHIGSLIKQFGLIGASAVVFLYLKEIIEQFLLTIQINLIKMLFLSIIT